MRFEPALRSSRTDPRTPPSHPALAPGLALRPTHPGSHSGPVFRAVRSGLALRPRPAPTFCPALWVADLKGGFWKEAFAFRAQAPVPAFWPCVPALTTRSSRPGSSHSALRRPRTSTHAPRLALRSRVPGGVPRSRAPTQTCPPHSAPRFGRRILAAALALRPRIPTLAHPGPAPRPRTRPRASAHAPRLALRSRVPGGALRSRAPTQTCPPHSAPRFGRRILAAAPAPGPPPAFRSAFPPSRPGLVLWAADSGGGSCAPAPHSGSAPRSSHSAPPAPRFCTPPPALRSRTPPSRPGSCIPAPHFGRRF